MVNSIPGVDKLDVDVPARRVVSSSTTPILYLSTSWSDHNRAMFLVLIVYYVCVHEQLVSTHSADVTPDVILEKLSKWAKASNKEVRYVKAE